MSRLHLKVGGMHCSLCTNSIHRALVRLDGVTSAQVSIAHEEVLIDYDSGRVQVDTLIKTLHALGYSVREPNRTDVFSEEKRELARARQTAAVAGVLVGIATIIMFLKFWRGPHLSFYIAQGIIALTASVWPASFVFRNAWQSLRRGILNQDVLAASAALAGQTGGLLGLLGLGFPAGAFFSATTYVLGFHCVGGFASVLVHVRASQSVQRLLALQPETARLLDEEGRETEVPVSSLNLGSFVRVRPGERIPVDGQIEEGTSSIDQQLVTGEPLPIDCQPGDEAIGGSLNLNGSLVIKVTRIGEDSFLRRVARQVAEARVMKPGILRLVDRILTIYVPTVFILALAGGLFWSGAAWLLLGKPLWLRAGFSVLGALVMGYPCALGMATPLAIIRASGETAERGILMRSGEAFQVFRLVDTIVFDKTGTLTEGKPQLVGIWSANGNENEILTLAAGAEAHSEHPLAKAIVKAAEEWNLPPTNTDLFNALPGRGIEGKVNGREMLVGTERLLSERGVAGINKADKWVREQRQLGRTTVFVAVDGKLIGAIALADRIKDEAVRTLSVLKKRDIEPVMATGDHERVAFAVAQELGITKVQAQLLPEDKLSLVRELQREGRKVAFVGDGINDAPSLMQADVGIAVGTGTDIAIEAADVVLPGERLEAVVEAHSLAGTSYLMTVRNVFLALTFNGVGILVSLTGRLDPVWAMLAMTLSLLTVYGHSLFGRLLVEEDHYQKFAKKIHRANRDERTIKTPILTEGEAKMKMVDFNSCENVKVATFSDLGMNCVRCQAAVEKALNQVAGVQEVNVDLKNQSATVVFNPLKTDVESLDKAIAEAGYTRKLVKLSEK